MVENFFPLKFSNNDIAPTFEWLSIIVLPRICEPVYIVTKSFTIGLLPFSVVPNVQEWYIVTKEPSFAFLVKTIVPGWAIIRPGPAFTSKGN